MNSSTVAGLLCKAREKKSNNYNIPQTEFS